MTIELPPDVEAGLLAQARAEGLPPAVYVERLLRERFPAREANGITPAERAAAWIESLKSLPDTPVLSDYAMSREAFYSDRG